jgi:hypothetical protein
VKKNPSHRAPHPLRRRQESETYQVEYTGNPMTFEELTAAAIGEELTKAKKSSRLAKRGSVPPMPPGFLKSLARS